MKSRSWCTLGNAHKTIALVWFIGLLLSAPTLYVMETTVGLYFDNKSHVMTVTCADSNFKSHAERIIFVWYQLGVMFVTPVIVIVFCYAAVMRVLWMSSRQNIANPEGNGGSFIQSVRRKQAKAKARASSKRWTESSVASRRHNPEVKKARKQIVRMLMVIVVIFFCCWGPKLVLNVMKKYNSAILHSDSAFVSMLVINLLPYVHSCVNPLIYGFMSSNFRRSMRTACRRCPPRRRQGGAGAAVARGEWFNGDDNNGGEWASSWRKRGREGGGVNRTDGTTFPVGSARYTSGVERSSTTNRRSATSVSLVSEQFPTRPPTMQELPEELENDPRTPRNF